MAAPKKNPGNMCLYVCVSRGCFRHRSALANGFDDDVAPLMMMSTLLREKKGAPPPPRFVVERNNDRANKSRVLLLSSSLARALAFFLCESRSALARAHTHTPVVFDESPLLVFSSFFCLSCLGFVLFRV